MMKSKGFTLVEIIVSVALISIVLLLLFQLMTDMEYDSLTSMFASDNQVNRATIIKRIDKDLMDYGMKSIPSINNITNGKQIKLSFSNGSSKDIIVTSSTLTYDGESYTVSSGGSYDINNIKIVSIPSNSEKLCSYMLNIDTNNDGVCDANCGINESNMTKKNDNYVYCPIYQAVKIVIPVLFSEYDVALDDIEIFYIGKLS